jgi:hypothetical protein
VLAYELQRAFVDGGYDPQQPVSRGDRGGFTLLVQEVFATLGIKDSAEAAAARAECEWSARQKGFETGVIKPPSVAVGLNPESGKASTRSRTSKASSLRL